MNRKDALNHSFRAMALVALFASSATARANAADVRVRVPQGVGFAGSLTSPGPDGRLYVTLDSVRVTNPSPGIAQSYRIGDFHLLANGKVFTPVARPKLGAIDTIENGIVGPHEQLQVTVTFLVPGGTTRADFEFTPRWLDDTNGRTVDFCCYYI